MSASVNYELRYGEHCVSFRGTADELIEVGVATADLFEAMGRTARGRHANGKWRIDRLGRGDTFNMKRYFKDWTLLPEEYREQARVAQAEREKEQAGRESEWEAQEAASTPQEVANPERYRLACLMEARARDRLREVFQSAAAEVPGAKQKEFEERGLRFAAAAFADFAASFIVEHRRAKVIRLAYSRDDETQTRPPGGA